MAKYAGAIHIHTSPFERGALTLGQAGIEFLDTVRGKGLEIDDVKNHNRYLWYIFIKENNKWIW